MCIVMFSTFLQYHLLVHLIFLFHFNKQSLCNTVWVNQCAWNCVLFTIFYSPLSLFNECLIILCTPFSVFVCIFILLLFSLFHTNSGFICFIVVIVFQMHNFFFVFFCQALILIVFNFICVDLLLLFLSACFQRVNVCVYVWLWKWSSNSIICTELSLNITLCDRWNEMLHAVGKKKICFKFNFCTQIQKFYTNFLFNKWFFKKIM